MDLFKIANQIFKAGKTAGQFLNQQLQEESDALRKTYENFSGKPSDELRRIKNNSSNSWTKRATATKILKERGEE